MLDAEACNQALCTNTNTVLQIYYLEHSVPIFYHSFSLFNFKTLPTSVWGSHRLLQRDLPKVL